MDSILSLITLLSVFAFFYFFIQTIIAIVKKDKVLRKKQLNFLGIAFVVMFVVVNLSDTPTKPADIEEREKNYCSKLIAAESAKWDVWNYNCSICFSVINPPLIIVYELPSLYVC